MKHGSKAIRLCLIAFFSLYLSGCSSMSDVPGQEEQEEYLTLSREMISGVWSCSNDESKYDIVAYDDGYAYVYGECNGTKNKLNGEWKLNDDGKSLSFKDGEWFIKKNKDSYYLTDTMSNTYLIQKAVFAESIEKGNWMIDYATCFVEDSYDLRLYADGSYKYIVEAEEINGEWSFADNAIVLSNGPTNISVDFITENILAIVRFNPPHDNIIMYRVD